MKTSAPSSPTTRSATIHRTVISSGTATVRSVFVVDTAGGLRLTLHYPMEVGRYVTELLRAVRALQTSDAENITMPERWPENPNPGDRVPLKPPADVEAAARLANAEAECHRVRGPVVLPPGSIGNPPAESQRASGD